MLVNQLPPDGGMLYTETNMAQLFPEPLNAITSGFFLMIALYWTVKMKGNFKSNPFLNSSLAGSVDALTRFFIKVLLS